MKHPCLVKIHKGMIILCHHRNYKYLKLWMFPVCSARRAFDHRKTLKNEQMKVKFKAKIVLVITMIYTVTVCAQNDTIYTFEDDPGEIEYYFGFNLIPSAVGGLIHIAIIKPLENDKKSIIQITKDDFISQAMGKTQSLANPKRINFFKQYQINDPNVMDNLWRLRYKEYPYYTNEKVLPGWSSNDSIPFIPTESQMLMLNKFGAYKLNDYIYGENAFKLLYLMGKPEWIKSYKESY